MIEQIKNILKFNRKSKEKTVQDEIDEMLYEDFIKNWD